LRAGHAVRAGVLVKTGAQEARNVMQEDEKIPIQILWGRICHGNKVSNVIISRKG
jgi:hypothetical protein